MRYCKKCVQTDTRPGIYFNEEDVCGACLYQEALETRIDWNARQRELAEIAHWARRNNNGVYDCVIGVSGGKDSTFQSLYARDVLGLHPLLVNSEPENITDIGRHNIENLKNLGFDVISLRPNPRVMTRLVRKDFYRYLNPGKVTEYSLWASAYIVAQTFKIPLIIQGENPGLTLGVRTKTGTGGDALNANKQDTLEKDCLSEYAGDGVEARDLFLFHYDRNLLEREGVRGVWLSYYVKEWSQPGNAAFSIAHGLWIKPSDLDLHDIGTYRRYSQLDSELVQYNQMLKHIKFGFGQATDHACYDIREGRITREEAIAIVKEFDGLCAERYIQQLCDYIGITLDEFWRVANSFRGDMWEKGQSGHWKLKDPLWEQEPVGDIDICEVIARLERSLDRDVVERKKWFEAQSINA